MRFFRQNEELSHLLGSGTAFTRQAALTFEAQEVGQVGGSEGTEQEMVAGLHI